MAHVHFTGMTLFGRKTRRLGRLLPDGFLQFLGGAESHLLARLDLDGLARGGVAADAVGALADLEDARRCGYARPFQVLGDRGHQVGQDGFGLLLGQLLLLGDGRGEVLEGDGG